MYIFSIFSSRLQTVAEIFHILCYVDSCLYLYFLYFSLFLWVEWWL